jgi:hypothetical protein
MAAPVGRARVALAAVVRVGQVQAVVVRVKVLVMAAGRVTAPQVAAENREVPARAFGT